MSEIVKKLEEARDNKRYLTVDDLNEAIAALTVSGERDGWRPIESAPKNGTAMLLGAHVKDDDAMVCLGWWSVDHDGWYWGNHRVLMRQPTMWHPLPDLTPLKEAALNTPLGGK